MNEERGSWYLLTGLVLGLALGLIYAWVIQPARGGNTLPSELPIPDKEHYRALVAAAYAANGDLLRAEARLEQLGDNDMYTAVAEQAQRALSEDPSSEQARALGLLALALGQEPGMPAPTIVLPTSTEELATPALTPAATPTFTAVPITPTPTTAMLPPTSTIPVADATPQPAVGVEGTDSPLENPTDTPTAPFVLESQELLCDPPLDQPLVQVWAENLAGDPIAFAEIIVAWDGGEEHFFTGLKPDVGLGYADFLLTPGIAYSIRLSGGGQAVTGLQAETCPGAEDWGAWQLVFVRP